MVLLADLHQYQHEQRPNAPKYVKYLEGVLKDVIITENQHQFYDFTKVIKFPAFPP